MRRGPWSWGLLAAVLAAGAVSAQPALTEAPVPGQATEPEAPPPALDAEGETQTFVEEVAPAEAAVPSPTEEEYAEEEPRGSGYEDLTGTLENLEETEGLRVSVRNGVLRAKRGYTPLEVTLHNTDGVPRQVRLVFRGHSVGPSTTTREVELAPRQRLTTHLLIPAPVGSGSFSVEGPQFRTRTTGVYMDEGNVLAMLVLGTSKAFEASTGMARSQERMHPQVKARFLSAQEAPRELAAYVGYPVVLVTEDVASIPADVWAALENYAAVGGSLIVARPPRDVHQRLPLLVEKPAREEWNIYGLGDVYLCESPAASCASAVDTARSDATPMLDPKGPPPRWEASRFALSGNEKPLLPNAMAPVGRFLVLIFLFSLVVGPGGLVVARRKGPVALLIGVPAVALLTCLIIIANSLIGDGFVTHATRYSYTWLDRPRDRAVTSVVAGYYANLASEKVQMPATSVLMAPDELGDWLVDLEWKGGGMVVDGLLSSRTYTEWGELAVVPTRARLVMRREGAGWKVQNALGGPLEAGYVQLGKKLYELPALADGQEGVAVALSGDLAHDAFVRDFVRPPGGMKRRSQVNQAFHQPLEEGAFVARVGGAGFGPLASLEVELHEGVHFVRGQVETP